MSDIRISNNEPAPIDYLGAIRRRWWVVIIGIIIGVAAGLLALSLQSKVYDSATTVLVTDTGAPTQGSAANARTNSGINMDTEAQLVKSQAVSTAAQKILSTSTPTTQLVKHVTVTVPANTQVLSVSFSAGTPAAAQSGSRAFAQAYLNGRNSNAESQIAGQVAALQTQRTALTQRLTEVAATIASNPTSSAAYQQAVSARSVLNNQLSTVGGELSTLAAINVTPGRVLNDAPLPSSASSPSRAIDLGGGLLAGLLLGLIVAFALERGDRKVRTADAASRRAAIPLLTTIRSSRPAARLVDADDPGAVQYDRLRNSLAGLLADREMTVDDGAETVVVTGATTGATTGVIVANLAVTLARSGYPVTLICADRSSSSLQLLGVSADAPGLAQILGDGGRLQDVRQNVDQPGLTVIGPGKGNVAMLDRAWERLHSPSAEADAIMLIEVPFGQAELLSRRADVTLAVTVLGKSTKSMLTDIGASLDRRSTRLVAVPPVSGRIEARTPVASAPALPSGTAATGTGAKSVSGTGTSSVT